MIKLQHEIILKMQIFFFFFFEKKKRKVKETRIKSDEYQGTIVKVEFVKSKGRK